MPNTRQRRYRFAEERIGWEPTVHTGQIATTIRQFYQISLSRMRELANELIEVDVTEEPKITEAQCSLCQRKTQHDIIHQHSVSHFSDDYHASTCYSIIRCRGCLTVSFLDAFHDYEQGHYDSTTGEEEHPIIFTAYPDHVAGQNDFDGYWLVPSLVLTVYEETLIAIQNKSFILAGLGLRATIEAVCSHLGINGRNLEQRISSLASRGSISKKDSELLHGIRFLGNDAAHDIKLPKPTQISVAKKIVQHLLLAVYVLPKQAAGEIDSTVSDFAEFCTILEDSLEGFTPGIGHKLKDLLGPSYRRVAQAIESLETQLIAAVNEKKFPQLLLGVALPLKTGGKSIQLYKVASETPV